MKRPSTSKPRGDAPRQKRKRREMHGLPPARRDEPPPPERDAPDGLAPMRPPGEAGVRVRGERRPFTQVGGLVDASGDPAIAGRLSHALGLRAPARRGTASERLTHGFHTYPARMHPETARRLVRAFGVPAARVADVHPERAHERTRARERRPALAAPGAATPAGALATASAPAPAPGSTTILDPFCGSGTVLVEALVAGARAIGRDASPLAVRIARAKTWLAGAEGMRALEETAAAIARETLVHVRARTPAAGARPRDAEWFPPHVVHELVWLRNGVAAVADAGVREKLELCLSSILVKVSRRASDTDERVKERTIAPGAASRLFAGRAAELAAALGELARELAAGPGARAPAPDIAAADARALDLPDRSVDVIITSPPYPNTYDYLDLQRLRLRWLGLEPGALAEGEIGARRFFRDARAGVQRWNADGRRWVAEAARVLKPGGYLVALMGDGMVGNTVLRAEEALAAWGRPAGMHLVAVARQRRPSLEFRMRAAYGETARLEILAALRKG
jgi:SAM-dependent methyltransferase